MFRRTEFPSFGGVDQFSKKIETGWFLARIETVTPQQVMEKAKERGVIVDSRISF